MKKVLIILFSLILVVGCGKNNNQNIVNPTPNTEPKQEKVYYTEDQAQTRLKEIAEDIYKNQRYLSYTKEDGKYFIPLKELKSSLGYDTKEIDNIEGLICDENETGVSIDIDNPEKVDYVGYPVITLMLCNPPEIDNSEEQN